MKITVTGDLDEFKVAELLAHNAPVDTFGVGTKLVTGYLPPGFVFKLVAIEDGATMRPVAKRSIGKLSSGSAKEAYRLFENGVAVTEFVLAIDAGVTAPTGQHRALSQVLFEHGATVVDTSLETARATARTALAELPRRAFDLSSGDPVLATTVVTSARDEERQ